MKNIASLPSSDASLGIRSRRRAVHAASHPTTSLTTLAITGIVIAVLYFARDIFIPLALAILLSFVLGPLVMLLRRTGIGRVPSVIAVVLFAFLVTLAIGTVIGSQLTRLAEELPRYQYNIVQKIHSLKGLESGSGVVGRTSAMLRRLNGELSNSAPPPGNAPPAGSGTPVPGTTARQAAAEQPPVPVEIRQPGTEPLAIIVNLLAPLLQPFATAGIVIVFVIFFLLQREHLRDRFIRLVGSDDLRHTTEALDDAFGRLGRYLLTQTVINTAFGVVIGAGLWLIGIPNPVLWGMLGTLLRFIPYIGAFVAALFPTALAIAVDPGWSTLMWTVALFLVVEIMTGQFIEPYHYGRSTGLSTVAVVVATTFWTWLWGPIGLLLSMPLTLCLIVLGRHVSALAFLDVLLGDEPALTAEEKFYQRMLVGDSDDAAYQAEEFLKTGPLAAYYDEVAVKGLGLAQVDVNRGELDHTRRVQIKEAVDAVIDDLSDHAAPEAAAGDRTAGAAATSEVPGPEVAGSVLCIAGRGSLDEAVAAMLAQLLAKDRIGARVVPHAAVSTPNLGQLDGSGVRLVCLSYLEPNDFANARYLVRRLRRRLPNVRIVGGFWTLSAAEALNREALRETTADDIVTSLREAVDHVNRLVKGTISETDALPIRQNAA